MTEDIKKEDGLEVVGGESEKTEEKTKDGETITIEKKEFESLIDRINRLEAAGDKKQLARYDSANRDVMETFVNLIKIDDKIVKSWGKMKDNFVEKNEAGWWKENQTIDIIFMDDTKKSYKYIEYVKNYQPVKAKVLDEKKEEIKVKDYKGNVINRYYDIIFKVLNFEDNKEYTINSNFVN